LLRHRRDKEGNPLPGQIADQRGDARFYVYGPAWTEDPETDWLRANFSGTAVIYAHHGQMWLSAKAMQNENISMPDEARGLIEAVFGDDAAFPKALQASAEQMEGREYADASMAQMNTLSFSGGYTRGGGGWLDEAQAPSRLGEKSVRVLLACWENGRLRPWSKKPCKEIHHAWAYSALPIPERLISAGMEPDDPEQRRAYLELLENIPGKGQWSIVLMLEKVEGIWQGWARKPAGKEKMATKPAQWRYDSAAGLTEVEAADE
jgi:CRISPR-associated endonuclease/helicase Cas3